MSVAIPRKDENGLDTPGMGNAYIEFYTIEESKEARRVNIFFNNFLSNYPAENIIKFL